MPCGNCGSKDHNRRTCPKAKPAAPPPAKVTKLPAKKAERAEPDHGGADVLDVDLEAVGVEDLVALRKDIDAELKRRRDRAAVELAKLNGVLGDAA
jgi:hypothetical protein